MKLLLLLSALVALLTGVRVLCQDPEPKEDADYWTSTNHQDGWLSSEPLREMLLRMTRKPRPHQFIGLMGRRSTGEGCSICVCVCVWMSRSHSMSLFAPTSTLPLPPSSKRTDHQEK
uniref:Tachykinin 1 n=1 Tax=Oryzias latipes TaxID=8090 RepID=A0A3B3IP44_ORYLA